MKTSAGAPPSRNRSRSSTASSADRRQLHRPANFYTKSHSEKIILGDHIGRDPAKRDRLVIATKFSGNLYPGDPNGGGSGRKSVINACEHSLRRLQTDYIDL